jgi:general stress protein YciG
MTKVKGAWTMDEEATPKPKILRGFAVISPERRKEIASMGGKAVPAEKRTFSRDREKARQAGTNGGSNVPAEKRAFSTNKELAMEAGRKGGSSRNTMK